MSLPNGVQELQWVKANGNVYLNTTFNPNQNTRVVADVEWDASATTSWLFGARNRKNRGAFAFLTYKSAYRADYGSATKTLSVLPSGRFTVEMDKNVVKINGETVATASSQNFTTNYPMVLFANNTAGTISGYTTAKLYSLKIYDNSTLVRDYIPVRSTSGSTAGLIALYDAVHNIVHGPSGSGDFEAGPEKTEDQAHKALIDGTARDVTSGTCLVGGTAYAIKKGRTLIGGTSYEIGFSNGFTWIIGDTPAAWYFTETIGFVSNGERFIALEVAPSGLLYAQLIYFKEGGGNIKPFNGIAGEWGYGKAYKTVTFDEEPTGTLLRWLQANAVQQ